MSQSIFKRVEIKYLLSEAQYQEMMKRLEPYMRIDEYGLSEINSIYYDTEGYDIVRESLEKPVYKEKIRLRSYGKCEKESTAFVELKKKYEQVVYKRRIALPEEHAVNWLNGTCDPGVKTQITSEIEYFMDFYKTLHPVVFLSYEREAFFSKDGSDFRVTFDDTILCREDRLSLEEDIYGTPILPQGMVLMEIKCSGGIPLWMTRFLSEEHIYKWR